MPKEIILDWILDSETCFLLGAGTSRCAGKPMMADLTSMVTTSVSVDTSAVLSNLKGGDGREATVEDFINYLLRMKEIVSATKVPNANSWTVDYIEKEIGAIQHAIAVAVGKTWEPSPIHSRFFQRLLGQKKRSVFDVFTLNYDTVLEATLESLRLRYVDGFWGSENALFNANIFDEVLTGPAIRLHKLHGSINWERDETGAVRRRTVISEDGSARLVIYPTEQKYVQTQYGVYETLMTRFRDRLRENRPNNKLVVLGYSFADDHVNLAIEDSLLSQRNLTVYAFLGVEKNVSKQRQRLQEIADRCNARFNAWIGQTCFIGEGLENEEWESTKGEDLWKFENLVNFITGVSNEPTVLTNSQGS